MNRTFVEVAAFANAIAPDFSPSGVQESEQFRQAGDHEGLQTVVVSDASGRLYDTTLADGQEAIDLLTRRARASVDLKAIKETGALRFHLANLRYFNTVVDPQTGQPTAVLISRHDDGAAPPFAELTLKQCGAIGAAIASIHRLPSASVREKGYPVSSAADLSGSLPAWIRHLSRNQQIPKEIVNSWSYLLSNPKLFDYRPTLVHGGYVAGDVLFSSSGGVSQVRHWERLRIDDPASDLAWAWRMNEARRDAVTTAYARVIDDMDEMIVVRARLWLQMDAVVRFLQALDGGSDADVVRLKADLDRLATQIVKDSEDSPERMASIYHPDTMTLSNVLTDTGQQKAPRKWVRDALGPGDEEDDEPAATQTATEAFTPPSLEPAEATATQALDPAQPATDSDATIPRDAVDRWSRREPERAQRFRMPDLDTHGLGLSGDGLSSVWARDVASSSTPIANSTGGLVTRPVSPDPPSRANVTGAAPIRRGFDPTVSDETWGAADDRTRPSSVPTGLRRAEAGADGHGPAAPRRERRAAEDSVTSTLVIPQQASYLTEDEASSGLPRVIPPIRRLDDAPRVAADDSSDGLDGDSSDSLG